MENVANATASRLRMFIFISFYSVHREGESATFAITQAGLQAYTVLCDDQKDHTGLLQASFSRTLTQVASVLHLKHVT